MNFTETTALMGTVITLFVDSNHADVVM